MQLLLEKLQRYTPCGKSVVLPLFWQVLLCPCFQNITLVIEELFCQKFADFLWINFRPKYMFAGTNNSQVWIPAWWLLYSDTLLSIPVLGSTSSYLRALGDQWLGDSQVEDYITKIPSEMEVALRYTLLTLLTLFALWRLFTLQLLYTA